MIVGIASGTYSSIFIAAPVLTAWKEREPAYRRRRERIEEQMGNVPPFPEENVIARLEGDAVPEAPAAAAPAPEPAAPAPSRGQVAPAAPQVEAPPRPDPVPEPAAASPSPNPSGRGARS